MADPFPDLQCRSCLDREIISHLRERAAPQLWWVNAIFNLQDAKEAEKQLASSDLKSTPAWVAC
jgi:hypothetical protein